MPEYMSNKTNKIAAIILGVAAGVALYKYFSMSEEDRKEFNNHLKERTNNLLSDTDDTVKRVDHFMAEYDQQSDNAWIDKLYIFRKMLKDLYGGSKQTLL